jgi:hypothetical protein
MRNLTPYYPPSYGDEKPVASIINSLLSSAPKVSGQYLYSRPKPIARPAPFQLSSNLYSQVMRGLQVIHKLPEPMPFHAICEPAPWNPANDPIVIPRADRRTNGTAPGALPLSMPAVDLLASMPANDYLAGLEHSNGSFSPCTSRVCF